MERIKGYKVANADGKCSGFKFEVGQTYSHKGEVLICNSGFHFCTKAQDCFNYYSFDSKNVVFEVEGFGISEFAKDDSKVCVSDIYIVRQLTWQEVLEVANSGKDNTGHSNSGNSNSGNWNSGDWNSGNSNSGNRNSGNWNSGNRNSGDWNSGNRNSGNRNSGQRGSG